MKEKILNEKDLSDRKIDISVTIVGLGMDSKKALVDYNKKYDIGFNNKQITDILDYIKNIEFGSDKLFDAADYVFQMFNSLNIKHWYNIKPI